MQGVSDLLDKQAIGEIVRLERFWRDRSEWEKLAGAYTEDSRVRTTWFDGNGRAFAAASREMAEQRGRASIHMVTPTEIRINGDRALCESLGEIHNRTTLEGVEVDTLMYCRFFSRLRHADDQASGPHRLIALAVPPTPAASPAAASPRSRTSRACCATRHRHVARRHHEDDVVDETRLEEAGHALGELATACRRRR